MSNGIPCEECNEHPAVVFVAGRYVCLACVASAADGVRRDAGAPSAVATLYACQPGQNTVRRMDPEELPPEVRSVNRGLLDRFISADPGGRGCLACPRATMLYNSAGYFRYAVGARPNRRMLARLFRETSVRFWSTGI